MTSQSLPLTASVELSPSTTYAEFSKLTDEELISLMKAERGDALGSLFDRYFRLVLCVALRILRDAGEAEDLMQDVFLEIYRRACLFDASKGSAKTWILQYAYHRSMNRRQYLIARRFYKSEEISAVELGRWEPSYSPNGWDGLTSEERRRMLKKGMESLGDKQKRVLELAYSEGLLIKEIAERMGEPVEQVRSYYYRGLKKLRDVLHETGHKQEAATRAAGAAD